MNGRTATASNSRTVSRRWPGSVRLTGAVLVLALIAVAGVAWAGEVRFGYDQLGRLQWVQNEAGEVAIYIYDSVGNINQVIRGAFPDPNAPVGISAFAPSKGAVGTIVTIFGRGFDPAPGQNQVTFNGTPATVTAASPVQVTVTVPGGATSGPLVVTTPSGTAASAPSFSVLGPPTVTPKLVSLYVGQTQVFTTSGPAQWRVGGIPGGSASLGTITLTGTVATYQAPARIPFPGFVTITAASLEDLTLQDSASAEIVLPMFLTAPVSVAVRQPSGRVALRESPAVSVSVVQGAARVALQEGPALSVSVLPGGPTQVGPLMAAGVAVERKPVITGVSPAAIARRSADVVLTLTGEGLSSPTALRFLAGGVPDASITVSALTASADGTQATATISIAGTAAIGGRTLQITAAGTASTPAGTGTNVLQITGP